MFGLLRVVGCGACNNFHAFIPFQLCDKACIALSVLWVCCVEYLIDGIGWIDQISFRLALRLRREVNPDAVSLIHLVEGMFQHCGTSSIAWSLAYGTYSGHGSNDSCLPHISVLASLKRLVLRVGLSIRCATSKRNATWLILPVVICLSQRLSHACVSMNKFRL